MRYKIVTDKANRWHARKQFELCLMVGGRWGILFDGIQWAPSGYPRDPDGSGDWTATTRREAWEMARQA